MERLARMSAQILKERIVQLADIDLTADERAEIAAGVVEATRVLVEIGRMGDEMVAELRRIRNG